MHSAHLSLIKAPIPVSFATAHKHLFPLLLPLTQDAEYVLRQHLAEQFRTLAELCHADGSDAAYEALRSEILTIVGKLIADSHPEVSVARGICCAARFNLPLGSMHSE